MKGLRDPVEVRRTADHFPSGIDAELLEHGDHPAEDFGDAPSCLRRVDVDDRLSRQSSGQLTEAPDFLVADDFFVPIEQLHGIGSSGGELRQRLGVW